MMILGKASQGDKMNRLKKIARERYNEKTKNFSEDEKKIFDKVLEVQEKYETILRELHGTVFSEEYDFMYDSIEDAKDRNRGKNPMRESYIKRMNEKREKLGFLPLDESGMPIDRGATIEYCKNLLADEVELFS